ncbi:Ig-like domain-containing protein [Flavitalea flava]
MKRNLFSGLSKDLSKILLTSTLAFGMQSLMAGTSDNFNSRNGVRLTEIKGFLQGNCWFFSDFDVNRNGWAPNMEGDGAMVSGTGSSPTEMTGIYTPLLDIKDGSSISFKYKFNLPVNDRRWLKIYATDGSNKTQFLLDSLELTGSNATTVYNYQHSLTGQAAGQYKLYINYQGIGGEERIAIDQLTIDASAHYQSTCNTAPIALRDKFTGSASHTASGNVLNNDYDPNHETLTAYLLTESPDGKVELQKDGSFIFTPKDGFTGNSTHFSYKVCDNGFPALCSITTTANIRFPARASLASFQAMYRKKAVDINWNTASGNHSSLFEIERSLDGNNFEKVGEVKAENANSENGYSFTDNVKEGMVRRNDLFYRLRQLDAAKRITYSKVLIVRTYETKSVTAVSVTPDPGVNDIQVNVQLKERSFVVMKVTDNNGSEIIKQTAFGVNGANTYNITGSDQLQPGMYQLEVIINSNERLTMKLAKS